MGPDSYLLRFSQGAKDGGLIAFLPNGKAVFVHRDSPARPQPDEEWLCRVEERGSVGFAVLVERAASAQTAPPAPTAAGLNWNEVREAEERIRREVERLVKDAIAPIERQVADLGDRSLPKRNDPPRDEADASSKNASPDEIRRRILQQLHGHGSWGAKVHAGEHFRHGRLAALDAAEVRAALQGLVGEGTLLQDGRGSDARYSLNPAKRKEIAALLAPGPVETAPPATPREAPSTPPADYVERGEFENTLRNVREALDSLRRELGTAAPAGNAEHLSAAMDRRVRELEGKARGADATLTKFTARLDALAMAQKEAAAAKIREAQEAERADFRQTIEEDLLGDDDVPRPEQAATLAASLLPGDGMAKAYLFAARAWQAGADVGPPAPFYKIGKFGACFVAGCADKAVGFAPVILLTRPEEPGVLPALVCARHEDPVPWAVFLGDRLNRRASDQALDAFISVGERLGLPEPPTMSSQRILVFGSPEARRQWDLAAKRRTNR